MDKRIKLAIGAVAAVAVIGVGTGIAIAAGSDDETPLKGDRYDRAAAAALDHVGGGTVVEAEAGDDGSAYEVEIRLEDGSTVEVRLDESFQVIGAGTDEDAGDGGEVEAGD